MDDLNGLQWNSGGSKDKKLPPMSSSMFPSMRSTPPTSGRSTPFTASASNPPSKPATPANDSFANLVSFSSAPTNKNLSLQEQQKRLLEQKAQQQASKSKQLDSHFGGVSDQTWNHLGSGRSTPQAPGQSSGNHAFNAISGVPGFNGKSTTINNSADDDDILAAFNSSAPVDSSTHFPKPVATPTPQPIPTTGAAFTPTNFSTFDDDDDPFGLSEVKGKQPARSVGSLHHTDGDDDDVLGLLGKPVSELPKPKPQPKPESPKPVEERTTSSHPQDQAVAELVDMGFPAEKARQALETTESGLDVQAAVGWLLNQAHQDSKQKSRTHTPDDRQPSRSHDRERSSRHQERDDVPAWMRGEERGNSSSRRRENNTPSGEKDAAQLASEFGNTLFKTAGSLWKQGTKKMQQAVQEFNTSDSDSSTPKWMRDSSADGRGREVSHRRPQERGPVERKADPPITDEAMMLESDRARPSTKQPQPQRPLDNFRAQPSGNSRDHSPVIPSKLRPQESQPAFLRQQQPSPFRSESPAQSVKSSLNRQALEDQAASSYTSSARRRKPQAPAPAPTPSPVVAPEADLLDATAALSAKKASPVAVPPSTAPSRSTAPLPSRPRPAAVARNIPNISSNVLTASNGHREAGTAHFKRGDYSAAHESYTSALVQIPTTHPITIVILTNRALTALKIGEPKVALNDANNAISVIGSSKGEAETISISSTDAPKPMRDYYGKALMRKAEALEQMEKWSEAAAVWREAVDGGHGGVLSTQGRTRCEKAAGITKPKPATPAGSRPTPAKKPVSAPRRPTAASNQASDAAVSKLREANAAAEKADDEKFALADSVDAKLNSWKGGKADNLRALLGSLDTVLWPEAGWKKIGMAELVLPNKVKIQYMKGISKVHPDKISVNATTEQRMIAGAVFSTLNEAWDKFKKENNL